MGAGRCRRPLLRSMVRLLSILLLVIGGALAAAPAEAHAVLLQSTPEDGAVLAAAPTEIVLGFDEPVTPIRVELRNAAGAIVGGGESLRAQDAELHLAVPPGLGQGTYVLSYRVTSLDSHPVGGSVVFSIGKPSVGAIRTPAGSGRPWPIVAIAEQLLFFVGLIGASGGVLFHGLVARDLGRLAPESRRALIVFAGVGIAAALFGIGIEGAALANAAATDLLDVGLWKIGAATSLGLSHMVAALALVLLVLALESAGRPVAHLALPAALLALGSLALTGHALTAGPMLLTAPVLAIHVSVAAFWLGSLWPLWQSLARQPPMAAALLLRRFSAMAWLAILLLVAAGTTLAALQLGRVGALVETAYGQRLLAKLALVAGLLLIAAANRWWLTPALTAGKDAAIQRLSASIGMEIGLGLAILAATASLGETVPPRALAAQAQAARFSVATFSGARGALIEVSPGLHGRNRISIHLFAPDGTPIAARSVALELSDPAAGIEAIRRDARPVAPGAYIYEGPEMAVAGRWRLRIEALISDFDGARFETEVPIR